MIVEWELRLQRKEGMLRRKQGMPIVLTFLAFAFSWAFAPPINLYTRSLNRSYIQVIMCVLNGAELFAREENYPVKR